ncbi:MAG: hypothetical protein JWN51_3805, partial [Phycisphaerales bacterium]|nr:hypothetical protein [Phycisphaerales bacterium]
MSNLLELRALGVRTVLVLLAVASSLRAADDDAPPTKVAQATAAVARAKANALAKVADMPEYKAALADVDAKQKALDSANAKGTPEEKVDARAAYDKARQTFALVAARLRSAARTDDPGVKTAEAALAEAKQQQQAAAGAAESRKAEEDAKYGPPPGVKTYTERARV